MTTWHPGIPRPWSTSDLEGILDDALTVLAQIGVRCAHDGMRHHLAQWAGVSLSDDRLCFSRASVCAHLDRRRAQTDDLQAEDRVEFTLGGCWAGLNYCDPETQEIRPASSWEAARMARLWDARGLSGVVPLIPGDVPPALVTLAAERIALENTRYLGGLLAVTDPEEIRFLIEMNATTGRRYRLMEQVGISPLQFNGEGLATALSFLGRDDVSVRLSGFIPMAGATCPLDPRRAVVQSVAETLAFDLICSLLGIDGSLDIRVEPFDFQYASIVFGSPEWCLYRVLVLQMTEYLTGCPVRNGMFRSVAKRPNAQAACERTASVLWQALLGARHFGAVGQLSVDEVFSPQQAVLDEEILQYVSRIVEGLEFGPAPVDAVKLIAQGVREGSFVGVSDTVGRYRAFYQFPEIFRHWTLSRWREEKQPSILAAAWAQAEQEIAQSTYELDDAQRGQVRRIYDSAAEYVLS